MAICQVALGMFIRWRDDGRATTRRVDPKLLTFSYNFSMAWKVGILVHLAALVGALATLNPLQKDLLLKEMSECSHGFVVAVVEISFSFIVWSLVAACLGVWIRRSRLSKRTG